MQITPVLDFGISPQQFETAYFESNSYLRRGALSASAAWSELDQLLYQVEPREPFIGLFRQGPIPVQSCTESVIEFGVPRLRFDKPKLYGLLSDGATLVVNRVENHLPAARSLCNQVSRFTGQPAISNGYLSFLGDGTFGQHWYTHDVFAIQLLGRKRWQLFGPSLPLPLSHQKSEQHEHECPQKPLLDCVLEAGDMLYLPRGWWHRAIPQQTASFHVSVGTYAPTLYDYLMWTCTRHLPNQEAARRALLRVRDPDEVIDVLRELTRVAADPTTIAEFARSTQTRERTHTEFNLDLFLNRIDSALPADAAIAMNGNCYEVGTNEILVNGNRWRISESEDAVLRVLNQHTHLLLQKLNEQLPNYSTAALMSAIRELARREVVTVQI